MNDESRLTAEQLAQATSRALPADAALDSQTALLRDGFLQLGQSIEAANSDFDEAAFLSKLTAANETTLRPKTRNWWPLVLTAALAASALVAIVRITLAPADRNNIAIAPEQPSMYEDPPGAADSSAQLAWSDPLDEEIASAQDAVGQLSGRQADLDGSLLNFGSRLEALAAELESGSL
jgi:hypothetical protein